MNENSKYIRDEKVLIEFLKRQCLDFVKNNDTTKRYIIAIDGKSASGKTTFARTLKKAFIDIDVKCNIIHMDDFFLQTWQRNEARLNEVGGNVDYERFAREILEQIKDNKNKELKYNAFSCKTGKLTATKVAMGDIIIVEGAYAHHQKFGNYANITIFFDIDDASQIERIKKRNKNNWKIFRDKWIPLENIYIKKFDIAEKAMVIYVGGKM